MRALPRLQFYSGVEPWAEALVRALEGQEATEPFVWYGVAATIGYQNSYVDGSDVAEFRRDGEGNVWVRGIINKASPSATETIWTFPTGFRPRITVNLTSDGYQFTVDANGDLKYQGGGMSGDANMAAIVFVADGT